MIGETLSHYNILDKLGAGGMGEVYLASDINLDRRVALKILPQSMAHNPERLARFEREAKTLASLNHPNIVTIHSVETIDRLHFLTMELLEGRTLADFIPRSGLRLSQFFEIGIPLTDALAAAHERQVIHRDLKPSNVMVTRTGIVKVLDFGLAKQAPTERVEVDPDAPTEPLTGEGRVLGTIPYMSPEQLKGESVDHRTDIFSLGIILYQMATGDRPFKGTTSAEIQSSILRDVPDPVDHLKVDVPHHIARIVSLCLEKEPDSRFQSARDVRNELTSLKRELESGESGLPAVTLSQPRSRSMLGWGLSLLLVVGLVIVFAILRAIDSPEPAELMRLPMAPPAGLKPSLGYGPSVAISPQGQTLAYIMESGTTTLLYVKGLEELAAKPMSGTHGARSPTFSPDGRWIAFFDEDERRLKKISIGGGEPVTVAEADAQSGAAWAEGNTIFFSSSYGELFRVAADGGTPEPVPVAGEGQYLWPTLLPGDEVLLFTMLTTRGSFNDAHIAAVPVAGGTPRIVFESAYYPHYAPSGHLIFVQKDSVLAVPFDPTSLEVTGALVKVIEGAWTSSWTGYADYAFSKTGTLIYLSGGPDPTRAKIVSVDFKGEISTLVDARRPYRAPRVSPDGRQLALTIADEQVDIWSYDLTRGSFHRLTDSASWDAYSLWQPGTEWLTFSSMREGVASIYRKDLRTGDVEKLVTADYPTYPSSWSPDGELLAYTKTHPETGSDLWVHSLRDGSDEVFLRTPFNESAAEFSPDGRFLAYHSNEGGKQLEVYVRPFPEVNPRHRISTDGGRTARWGPDGKELFYIVGGRLFIVDIDTEPEFAAGPPRLLFKGSFGNGYDVMPSDPSFIMLREMDEGDLPLQINYIANWFDELSRRVPSGR